jgi:transcriptional regulator with XRE-family HTH domain
MTISVNPNSILGRSSLNDLAASTPLQSQVDGLVSHFVDEAANPTTLAAMVAGGMAYRLGRTAVLSSQFSVLSERAIFSSLVRGGSIGFGLASEVTAFELTSRTLLTFRTNNQDQSSVTDHPSPNLWNWSGHGGWREGLLHSFLTFGILKGAGHLAREENILLQHVVQDGAMVAGHQMAQGFGIAPRPEGSLAEQLLQAEVTNLQLGAGMSLVHSVAPGISSLERSLDLSLGRNPSSATPFLQPELFSSIEGEVLGGLSSSGSKNPTESNILMMSGLRNGNGSSHRSREMEGLLREFPREMVMRALRKKGDTRAHLEIFQRNHQRALELAEKLLMHSPEMGDISRTIAGRAYFRADLEVAVRQYVENYRLSLNTALHELRDTEEFENSARAIASASFYLKDPVTSARKRAFVTLMGHDPREEIIKLVQLRPSVSSSLNKAEKGRDLLLSALKEVANGRFASQLAILEPEARSRLESVLLEAGREIHNEEEAWQVAQALQEMDLGEGKGGSWEEISEFLPGDSYRFSGSSPKKIRLADRSLIQEAPVFNDRSQLVHWVIENKYRIDLLASSGKRYSYHTVVSALDQAGKFQGDPARFLAVGSLLEYNIQLSRHPDLKQLLPPSESIKKSLEVMRRYFLIWSVVRGKNRNALSVSEKRKKAVPSLLYLADSSQLVEALTPLLKDLPLSCQYLEVLLTGKIANGWAGLSDRLMAHPTLKELRLFYPDGSIKSIRKSSPGAASKDSDITSAHQIVEEVKYSPNEMGKVQVLTPWETPETFEPFPQFIQRLRRESGLSIRSVSTLLGALAGTPHPRNTLGLYEKNPAQNPTWAVLQGLARIYGVDIRELIDSSNRTRYPHLQSRDWTTAYYPVLIERASDLKRIEFYRAKDPNHRSFGWLIFTGGKNPFDHRSGYRLAQKVGMDPQVLRQLQMNRHEPNVSTLAAIATALGQPEPALIHALNETFHPELVEPLAKLFPDQTILIDPQSEDEARIRSYLDEPGTLGQVLFAHRKSLPGHKSVLDMTREQGLPRNSWSMRESNQVEFGIHNWVDWIGYFQKGGIPLEKLHPFLEKIGVTPGSSRYLLAKALDGISMKDLHRLTGINEESLRDLFGPEGAAPELSTLLVLKKTLPGLDPAFFRNHMEGLSRFFPEASLETPVLYLSRRQIEEAMRLDIGERLYRYRMENGLGKVEMGNILGVSSLAIDKYEKDLCSIENPETLFRLAARLGIDPKVVYLHYYHPILNLLPVSDRTGGQTPVTSSPEEFSWATERSDRRRILRSELQQALSSRGIRTEAEFARFFKWEETPASLAKARKWMRLTEPLNFEEVESLARGLKLPPRSWVEKYFRSSLVYFLGAKEDGTLDFSFPASAKGWRELDEFDLQSLIERKILARFPSFTQAARGLNAPYLASPTTIRKGIEGGNWKEETMARLSRDLEIDQRLIYFYLHRVELRRLLESEPANP